MPNTAVGFDVEANVRKVVRMLMARDGVQNQEIAELIGKSSQSVSARLAAKWTSTEKAQPPFRHEEILAIAEFFHVEDLDLFFRPPEIIVTREPRGTTDPRRTDRNNGPYSDILRMTAASVATAA